MATLGTNEYHGDEDEIESERIQKKLDAEDTMYDRYKYDDEFMKAFNNIFKKDNTK